MRKLITTLCLTLAVLLGSVEVSWSADFQKGLTAADSGDFATALREWTPLAEQGDAKSQTELGLKYGLEKGVIQDWVYAHMWGNLGASNGSETGAKIREIAAKNMTPSQLEKAQDLARECVRKKYKGC